MKRHQDGLNYFVFAFFVLTGCFLGLLSHAGPQDGVSIHTLRSHSRIVFQVDQNVPLTLKKSPAGFELFLKGIALSDLGASQGKEEEWKVAFKSLPEVKNDPRISDLKFEENNDGVTVKGSWKFPSGTETLANPVMEVFDYREKSLPHYVIDYWVKPGPTKVSVEFAQRQKAREESLKQAERDAQKKAVLRKEAGRLKAEAEDVLRYCKLPLTEETDIFLPFHPTHVKVEFTKWISLTTPDEHFPYYEPKSKDREAQYVRLALSLYRKGNPALAIRALDFFDEEFKGSNYRHEMLFLRANALIKLGFPEAALKILSSLVGDAKGSAVALHSGMFLSSKLVEKGSYLQALESFLWLTEHYPKHRLAWVFHLGAAESLFALKQSDRALKEYQWIIENAPERKSKAEAALRKGDLFLDRFQYEQALAAYFQGIHYFPEEAKLFPAIFVNRAEALYGLGQYERARKEFELVLEKYSSFPDSWRASFRLGEIHARMSSEGSAAVARKWFYDTINRFPQSPGATLARLRLIPCDDQGGFDGETMERFFFEEAGKFDSHGAVGMRLFPAFRGLAHLRGLITMGESELAVDTGIRELEAHPSAEGRRMMGGILNRIFRKTILTLIENGKRYEALAFYNEKSKSIPNGNFITETDYLLKLSQTASDLGLAGLGEELTRVYQKAQSSVDSSGRSPASIMRAGGEDIEMGFDGSEKAFTEAKARWIKGGAKEAEKIRDLLSKVVPESPFSFHAQVILTLLAEKESKTDIALSHLLKANVLMPKNQDDSRLKCWLASLQGRAGDRSVALEIYVGVEENLQKEKRLMKEGARNLASASAESPSDALLSVLGAPPLPSIEQVVVAQAEIQEKQGKWGEVARTYSRAVENGVGENRLSYNLARALLNTREATNYDKAIKALEGVASSKTNDFWKRLAQQTLENEKNKRNIRSFF
ncbi:tetratricopeptide repeat protein [Bdellovibrionota bacterium FG-2]